MKETLDRVLEVIRAVSDFSLFKLGDKSFTPWTLLSIVVLLVLVFVVARKVRRWLVGSLLESHIPDAGARYAMGTIAQYLLVMIGLAIIIQTVGVDLSALGVVIGALGVGIGFGLQGITNNFVSGIILLVERPVKVGDRIEVGQLMGDVVVIAIRATTVITNDNIAVIVPNSELVNGRVVNWSLTDRNVRVRIPIGVSYGSDPVQVRDLLMAVCDGHPGILPEPAPQALFSGFGDSSLDFELRVWTDEFSTRPSVLTSEVNFLIFAAFAKAGIEIPFPQRDLHLKSGFERVLPPASESGSESESKQPASAPEDEDVTA